MANLHTPERQHDESFAAYRERRAASNRANRNAMRDPNHGLVTEAELRDENGAYTLVGSTYEVEGMAPDTNREHVTSSWVHGEDMGYTARRKWLAGISAQRGY